MEKSRHNNVPALYYFMDIRDGIYGLAVGDAYGVPFEFLSPKRIHISENNMMVGYGSHKQPAGTWSDDTSLTLCLLDNLDKKIDYEKIMCSFAKWYKEGIYSSNGKCFDVGRGTEQAILNYLHGIKPIKCGSRAKSNNGNGSLMRVLPLAYYFFDYGKEIDRSIVSNISSMTHGNSVAIMACNIYVEFGYRILAGEDVYEAYRNTIKNNEYYWYMRKVYEIEDLEKIANIQYDNLSGSGYVIDTLQSVLWVLLNTESYEECILKAVMIGGDTDTIAAVAGGIAGMIYGKETIPVNWMNSLKNKELIENICSRWIGRYSQSPYNRR